MTDRHVLNVAVDRPYDVVVGRSLLDDVVNALPGAERIAIIHPAALSPTANAIADAFKADARFTITIETPDAEAAKTAEVLAYCWTALGQSGFTRSDAIVTVGGGATTDLGGFVAATWLRGVRVVHVPTTLLGMVDAAVGGKTGINTPEGKNLVGSFWHPTRVVCDLNALGTLPRNDIVAGMAEIVKTGFIADPKILEIVEAPEGFHARLHALRKEYRYQIWTGEVLSPGRRRISARFGTDHQAGSRRATRNRVSGTFERRFPDCRLIQGMW